MRSKLLFAATALAATLGAGAAAAQTYDRLVAFGDSLSDSGNIYRATAQTTPPSPPYFQGRYSNGPTFVELLGFPNLQLFGATTGNVNNAFAGAETGLGANPPGLRTQFAAYRVAGGTFGPNTLVSVLGGGNDVGNGILPASVQPNPVAAIQATAVNAVNNLSTLVTGIAGAGAGTVIVGNLPDLAATPLLRPSAGAPLADIGTQTFNAALANAMGSVAAANPNTNIILVDIYRLDVFTRANGALLGFSNVTDPCLNTTTGVACSNPDAYYYWDPFHPTAATQRNFAAAVLDYAYYGARGAASAAQGEAALEHRASALDGALEQFAAEMGERPGFSLTVEGVEASEDARGDVPSIDRSTLHVRAALTQRLTPDFAGGVQVSLSSSDVEAGATTFEARSLGVDGFLGWSSGAVFVNGVAGMSVDEYDDLRRRTGVGPVTHVAERFDGNSWGARLQAGLRTQFGAATLSPRASVGVLRVNVDPYSEEGPIARHSVRSRDIEAFAAEAAVRLETPLGANFAGHLEAGYGEYLEYDGAVATALVNNPARPLEVEVEEPGKGFLLNAGLEGAVWGAVRLGVAYRGRFDDGSDSHGALLTLRVSQ